MSVVLGHAAMFSGIYPFKSNATGAAFSTCNRVGRTEGDQIVPFDVNVRVQDAFKVVCAQGLSETLFERLQGMYGDDISEMLTVQYRMHAGIMQWSSDELYDGRLTAHASVAQHTLADLKVSNLPSVGVYEQACACTAIALLLRH